MKTKLGFNVVFAVLAFPIGLALIREFDFDTFTFRKKALGMLYLIVFVVCLVLMFKKRKSQTE